MHESIKQLCGRRIEATDGMIGEIKDFYIDTRQWAIRYIVAETNAWLPDRQVLISPHSIWRPEPAGRVLRVGLTRKQIENCPPAELHKPLSRQYEEEYFKYYGWPFYWEGQSLWGPSDFPNMESEALAVLHEPTCPGDTREKEFESHLVSSQAAVGYHIHASNGLIGRVYDFLIDARSWAVRQLVVKTGHWLWGKHVLIPPTAVEQFNDKELTLFVNLTKDAVKQSPISPVAA